MERDTLKHEINPAIEKFITDLLIHKEKLRTQGNTLDLKIKDAQNREKDLQKRIADNNKKTAKVREELQVKIEDARKRSEELSNELSKQRALRDEALNMNREAGKRLKEAENLVFLREQEFERAKLNTEATRKKLEALKKDDVAINNRNIELNDLQRKLDTQKKAQDRTEERLMDREIKLMARETKVKQAEKRYNFEQAKKENE